MSIYEKQRDILFDACKKVATDQKCPKWIADILRDAVITAKNLKEDFPSFSTDQDSHPEHTLQVGDIVIITNNNTSCVAKLIEEQLSPGTIRIFDVQVTEGNKNNPTGTIFHNVPETIMRLK